MIAIIVLCSLAAVSECVKLPSNFKKCGRKQPDFKECLFEAARLGIHEMTRPYKELNVPNLDPFHIDELTINGGDGPVNLKQKFTDCKLYGLPTLQLDKFEIDFDEKQIRLSGVFPEVQKLCNYEMKGRVLLLQIDGRGHSNITLKQLRVTEVLKFHEITKKGKTYMQFDSNEGTMDAGLVIFDFERTGDKSVTDAINPVINDNWKEIFDDVKGGYTELFNQILISVANNVFLKVSLEEAFD